MFRACKETDQLLPFIDICTMFSCLLELPSGLYLSVLQDHVEFPPLLFKSGDLGYPWADYPSCRLPMCCYFQPFPDCSKTCSHTRKHVHLMWYWIVFFNEALLCLLVLCFFCFPHFLSVWNSDIPVNDTGIIVIGITVFIL